MGTIAKKGSGGMYGIVLAAMLCTQGFEAQADANATPVPFQQAPATISEAEMQANLENMEGFMANVDRFIAGVHTATEDFRVYVQDVKFIQASCEVESDTSGFENTGFEGLIAEGGFECRSWAADFNQNAMTYAARLDEALAFQKIVQQVGERLMDRMDRTRVAMQATRVKRAVARGLSDLNTTREAFKPWMSSIPNTE